jgi:4-diphosphocytidyl-2-C-methyl-D-erythritol kinase
MYNVFEEAVLPECPLAAEAKKTMLAHGAVGAMMSGSGSTIFGLYRDEKGTEEAHRILSSLGYVTHVCKVTQ